MCRNWRDLVEGRILGGSSPGKGQNKEDDDAEKTGWSGGNEYHWCREDDQSIEHHINERVSTDEMRRVRSSFSKGVSLRATRTDRTETTSTEISVSHRTPSLISRVKSHKLKGPLSLSKGSNYCVSVLCYLRSNVLNGSSRVGIAFNGKMLRAFLSRQLGSWTIRL